MKRHSYPQSGLVNTLDEVTAGFKVAQGYMQLVGQCASQVEAIKNELRVRLAAGAGETSGEAKSPLPRPREAKKFLRWTPLVHIVKNALLA